MRKRIIDQLAARILLAEGALLIFEITETGKGGMLVRGEFFGQTYAQRVIAPTSGIPEALSDEMANAGKVAICRSIAEQFVDHRSDLPFSTETREELTSLIRTRPFTDEAALFMDTILNEVMG